MSEELTKAQQLLMWQLFAAGGEQFLKDIEPRPKGTPHNQLAKKGFLIAPKRGSSIFLTLSDRGWRWIADSEPFPIGENEKRVTSERRLLQSLTIGIKRYADENGKKIQDLIRPAAKKAETAKAVQPTLGADNSARSNDERNNVATAIKNAFFDITGRPARGNVRLSQLRARLGRFQRDEIDKALVAMWKSGEANLMDLDNPRDIEAETVDALKTGIHTFHVVRIKE